MTIGIGQCKAVRPSTSGRLPRTRSSRPRPSPRRIPRIHRRIGNPGKPGNPGSLHTLGSHRIRARPPERHSRHFPYRKDGTLPG
jgi:hypothetical protein